MARATRTITASTAVATAPIESLEAGRAARDALAALDDDDFVEVALRASDDVTTVLPVALLRRYLETVDVPGRSLYVFDSDEEVSSEVAGQMLGISRPYLNELLDLEAVPYRRVGNQRRIRVLDLEAYRQRRDKARSALQQMAAIVDESSGGWDSQ